MKVLITGGTGFVGARLVGRLRSDGSHHPVASVRSAATGMVAGTFVSGEIGPATSWQNGLTGVDVVVHCAARVHVMNDNAADPLDAFRHVNVEGTLNLARQAAAAGVRRFIFISSVKVNGEATQPGKPYTADDVPAPVDSYGISKREAEQGLLELGQDSSMEIVIIRPVLVYGPGVKANFLSMIRWLYKGIPLPLGATSNRRSLVALDNLVDLIVTCIDHPGAAGQIFLVSDGEDLSTTQLLQRMAKALGKQARLLSVPSWILVVSATVLGKRAIAQRLCGSLQVDISKTCSVLGWTPPLSVDDALRVTAQYFQEKQTQ